MKSLTQLISILLLILASCSCCKHEQEVQTGVQPIWKIEIPTGSSNAIYSYGLCTLPQYGDWIIAHTTIADETLPCEDNRLCAVNIKTKQVDWFFPSDITKKQHTYFDGKGYLHDGKVVFSYGKDDDSPRSVVCLDLATQKVAGEPIDVDEDYRHVVDVIGVDDKAYYVKNSHDLYCYDLTLNNHTKIWDSDTLKFYNFVLTSDAKYLVVFEFFGFKQDDVSKCRNYINILNRETLKSEYFKRIDLPDGAVSDKISADGIEKDGILYINIDQYWTALDWKNNRQLWGREDLGSYWKQDMYVYNNTLMACCINAILGYDIHSGAIKYFHDFHGAFYTTIDGPYAYVRTSSTKLEIIEIETGKILDTIISPHHSDSSVGGFYGSYPTIHGDKMYIMGDGHYLYCYPKYPW